MKIQFNNALSGIEPMERAMANLVNSNPSANCFKAKNNSMGSKEKLIKRKKGWANWATSWSWSMEKTISEANSVPVTIKVDKVRVSRKPSQAIFPTFLGSFAALASATKGPIAVVIPIPKTKGIPNKARTNDEAAKCLAPTWPTIAVSIRPNAIWEMFPKIMGPANLRISLLEVTEVGKFEEFRKRLRTDFFVEAILFLLDASIFHGNRVGFLARRTKNRPRHLSSKQAIALFD